MFAAAEADYWSANQGLQQHNAQHSPKQGQPATAEPLSFGRVNVHEGHTCDGRQMSKVGVWELLLSRPSDTVEEARPSKL